uniref:Sushi domain-containing protein n=1 Tax=Tetraodon nigroviridis TaxID=99883 RepID=H3CAB1_TETNG
CRILILPPCAFRPLPQTQEQCRGLSTKRCAIIRPPRDGGIRYRGLTQEQIRSVQILPVDYEIEYICRGNRVIVGPKVRKCLPNGTWTDMSQHSRCCSCARECGRPVENGRVAAKPPGPPVEGTTLHYSCHAGFMLEGRNMTHCTKLGKWDAPKPTCLYDRNYTGKFFSSFLHMSTNFQGFS